MRRRVLSKKGFTLVELVVAIVIVSIISVMAGMGLVQLAKGYSLAKTSNVAAQQAQIALTRLGKELAAIQAIDPAETTATSIKYKRMGDTDWRKVAWTTVDQPLTLDGDTLIDKVHSFSLTYRNAYSATASSYSSATALIELTFQLNGYGNTPLIFVKRVAI